MSDNTKKVHGVTMKLDADQNRALKRIAILRGSLPSQVGRELVSERLYQLDETYRAIIDQRVAETEESD